MKCAWQNYLSLLPLWMRQSVDKLGKNTLLELRLRTGYQPELNTTKGVLYLERRIKDEDVRFCINVASRYSPWSAVTISQGYITAPGGHRIGICGSIAGSSAKTSGVYDITSLCIRVSRDFNGIASAVTNDSDSILIIGRPGSGKTTLLRDLIRKISNSGSERVAVVDERQEIFPRAQGEFCYFPGSHTDVVSGYRKDFGIDMVLRNMTPTVIALDEITADEDCKALLHAGWCGTRLIATAHASSKRDLFSRPVYRTLVESRLFDTLLVLREDKSWYPERMDYGS